MKIHSIMDQIQNTHWTRINNFSLIISFANNRFKNVCGWFFTNDDINKSIISVNTPQYQTKQIEEYTGYEWRLSQGRLDLYRFSLTFRDYDQMKLYNAFRNLLIKSYDFYFNDIKMSLKVIADAEFGVDERPIFQTTTAIIENVSQLQFSHNTENQIAEFTVSFKCNVNELGAESRLNAGNTTDTLNSVAFKNLTR